jgi:hypothetical protein
MMSDIMWKGVGEMSGGYLYNVKNNAITRNLEFSITFEYMWDLFIKQNRKCAYSGKELIFVRNYWSNKKEQTASLDRTDPTKGYIENNVKWIHKDVNQMKWDMSEKHFIEICKNINNYWCK